MMTIQIPQNEIDRFWPKVNKNGPDGCWIWTAYRCRTGHGYFQYFGKWGIVHRFSYMLHKGKIPDNMEVRHICHNPSCVNPDHLILGTHKDNMKDLRNSGNRKGIYRANYDWYTVPRPKTLKDRFWAKVNKDGPIKPHMDTPCWEWTAYCMPGGHGTMSRKNGSNLAHRISWELHHNQPIPDGMHILHKCDNPKCVNPDHLFIGTHFDNMQDMANKGRSNQRTGEQNNMSKLTSKQVIEIRKRYATTNVSQPQLAQEYGVTQTAIWYIIHRKNWKHI